MARRSHHPEMHPVKVGARLSLLREASGRSAADLCRMFGINKVTYSLCERGKRPMPEHTKVTLAEFYGITLDYLILGRASEVEVERVLRRLRERREKADEAIDH